MSKIKKVFDRIWSTFIIVINTVYGLLITFLGFSILMDRYTAQDMWFGMIMSTVAIIIVNVINYWTRKLLREY